MLEGTGAVGALVPTLVGVAAANLAGDAVGGRGSSVYDEQLRDAGVPMLEETRAPREGGEDTTGRLAIDLVADAAPACLFPWETARRVERVLRETTHNGFPVVVPDDDTDEDADEDAVSPLEEEDRAPRGASVAAHHRRGRLVGLVLRSQLIVLLARRALHPARGAREERSLVRLLSRPDARDPGANDALDAAARTFHHRKTFSDRVAATSPQAVAGVGLTEEERARRVDVGAFMHIAPLAVRDRCAAWRAARYARAAGLRHLPVVDERNVCVGVLTRANLVEAEGEDHI
jgi:chloride channel 7